MTRKFTREEISKKLHDINFKMRASEEDLISHTQITLREEATKRDKEKIDTILLAWYNLKTEKSRRNAVEIASITLHYIIINHKL